MPLTVLLVAAGVLVYRYGWIAANMTETAAIEAYSARYVRYHGGSVEDCHAVPGENVWLEVRCRTQERSVVYKVNRFGGLVHEGSGSREKGREPRT